MEIRFRIEGVHFDPTNPFSPVGQTLPGESAGEVEGEEEGGSAGLEVTGTDLEQLPFSITDTYVREETWH